MTPPGPSDPLPRVPAPSVAPAERERVVEALTQLFACDQIAETDLEHRLDRAYRATSAAELQSLLADLPLLTPARTPPPERARDRSERIASFLSGQQRTLMGVVPRALELRARLGYVELDLTQATFAPGVTAIDVHAFMGYVQIRLPAGIQVESEGRAFAGFFSIKGSPSGDGEQRVVRLTGRASLGFAECYLGGAAGGR
jgi:hypothetical protein